MKKIHQSGVFLLEALIAILIFSLGILGMVALGGTAVAAQTDAQFRTDAANFAGEIASQIALNVNFADTPANISTAVAAFAHRPIPAGYCNFAGATSPSPIVATWVNRVKGAVAGVQGLPGATDTSESIAVDTAAGNRVTVTVCWKPPSTSGTPLAPWHRHVLVSYIN
jgi:type IV pilus assembly protein PilV